MEEGMSEHWGPWIEHDGALPPKGLRDGFTVEVLMSTESGEVAATEEFHTLNFLWRWKTVRDGWFGKKRVRVCDYPMFYPVIRYRVRKPRALQQLRELIETLPETEKA
jgi:hypothetical protein